MEKTEKAEKTTRWQKLRGSRAAKVIAFLLAVVTAAGACSGAVTAISLYRNTTEGPTGQYVERMVDETESLVDYLFYYLHEDALTDAGNWEYAQLQERYSQNDTNLRFRISTNGTTVVSNVSDAEFLDTAEEPNAVSVELADITAYDAGRSRWLSYYLDLSLTDDWQIVTGAAETWAAETWASDYFYDVDGAEMEYFETEEPWTDTDTAAEVVTEAFSAADTDVSETTDSTASATYESGTEYYYYRYTGSKTQVYTIEAAVSPEMTRVQDDYWDIYQNDLIAIDDCDRYFNFMRLLAAVCLPLFLLALAWLTWSIGWDAEGVLALRRLNRLPGEFPLAVLIAGGFLAAGMGWYLLNCEKWYSTALGSILLGAACGLGGTACWCVLAAQIKTRQLLSRSLCVRVWRWLRGNARRLSGWLRAVLAQWPLYWKLLAVFAVYAIIQSVWSAWAAALFGGDIDLLTILFNAIPALPLAALACKWALDFSEIRKGAQKLAQGELDYKIDVSAGYMLPDLRVHAEELGQISEGLSHAVEERVKSQRFKTELITNVSHDLKTPLTSIINYVDLLKKLNLPDEKAREYIDVLDRKSQRLKTLTEDLVEASKAASGAIGVQLERLDLSQLVEQAAAEYEERLSAAGLTPVISHPEQPCMVMADGRHLWRVLDNLLGNCTKYAMPGTRVYLDVTCGAETGTVTVKNISADPLNVPAEELLKRFVRGDASRTTEGSGLGLFIARNLTAAQKGSFDLVVDGDLFKAIIALPLAEPSAQEPPASKRIARREETKPLSAPTVPEAERAEPSAPLEEPERGGGEAPPKEGS